MPDAQLARDGVGDVTVGLDGHHGIGRIGAAVVEMGDQLVKRFGTDAAGEAVFEEQQRPVAARRQRAVELVEPMEPL